MSPTVSLGICLLVILPGCIAQSLYTPPNIKSPTTPSLTYISASKDVVLNCTADGSTPLTFKWRKDWEDITDGDVFTVDESGGSLTIKSFTLREQGKYQCLAQNKAPNGKLTVAVSPVITLEQEQLATEWPVTPVKNLDLNEGDYAYMNCSNVPESVPKATFSWFVVTSGAKEQIKPDNRIYIDNTGTLHFMYLVPEDGKTDAEYKCAIYNTKDAFILGSPYTLNVKPQPTGTPQAKPKDRFLTNNVTFLITKTAELECVFSGNPVPTIEWYVHGRQIFSNEKYEISTRDYYRKLLVKDLNYTDEGFYTCKGRNSGGVEDASVKLDVKSGPIWKNGLTSRTIPEGRSVRFTCQARVRETMLTNPVWFKNGEQMTGPLDENMEYSERQTVLTLLSINKPDDIMCFQCNVSNNDGFEFASACLNVIKPIKVNKRPPDIQEIEKGDAVDLTVVAETDPDLTLRDMWYFRNITYDGYNSITNTGNYPPYVVRDAASNTYYINTSSLTDEEYNSIQGVYYREFYHQFERKNVTTEVILKGPIPGPVVQATFPWWVIVLVIVLILLILLLILIILCCCRNKEQGAYKIYKTEVNTAYLDPDKDLEASKFGDVARIHDDDEPDSKTPLKLGPAYDLSGDEADSLDQYQGGKPPRYSFAEDASFIGEYATRESQDL